MDLGQDVTNITANISAKMGMQSIKLAGELAKQVLLLLLEKQKEHQKTQIGEIPLKKLLKSGEELQTIKISKENLEMFQQRAKELGVSFAGITSQEGKEARVIFKSIQINLVKEIMKDLIEEKSKINEAIQSKDKLISALDRVVDIQKLDEDVYRHEIKDIDIEKVKFIAQKLNQQGIQSDVSVKAIKDNLETVEKEAVATVSFNVPSKDRDKASEIINELKEKTLEELKEIVVEAKEENKDKEKTLDEVIKDATDKANARAEESAGEKNKSKVRTQHEER